MAMSANIEHATSKTRLKNDKNHIYKNYESYWTQILYLEW